MNKSSRMHALRSRGRHWWCWLTTRFNAAAKSPVRADRVLLVVWLVTRLLLLLGMIIGAHYSDPQFYKYAGEFATGKLPYRDFGVEYPPLAMVLLLAPALVLLPFSAIAPQPDPAFVASPTALPTPDPQRYSVYGLSFGIEMLLIDLLTLVLVRAVARRLIPGDRYGMKSGLLYLLLVFASGALLQKFDLVAGTLCLAAILALINRQTAIAFITLGLATLVKGFPILLVPAFLGYLVYQADAPTLKAAIPRVWRRIVTGVAWFGATLAAWTLLIIASAGWDAISETLLYQARRGIEIESLFANVELLVGWLPGLVVHTDFSPLDLSRVVHSALDGYADTTSMIMAIILIALAYLATWLAFQRIGRPHSPLADGSSEANGIVVAIDEGSAERANERAVARGRVLIAGSSAVLLAFMLSFLALPAHYLLMVIPLLVCVRLPSRRSTVALFATTAVVAVLGQLMTVIWPSLRDLQPWAVAILTGRNLAWLAVFGVLAVAMVRWPVLVEPAPATEVSQRRSRRAAFTAGRRALAVRWRRRWQHAPPLPGFTPRGEDVFAHTLADVSPLRIIVICGLVSTLVYICLVAAFPLTLWWSHPHASDNPNVINDMGRITGYSAIAAFGFVLAIVLLFGSQFFALIAAGRVKQLAGGHRLDRLVRWSVIGFPLIFALIMIWMQPVTTTDLYGYVARGYLQVHFHANPMVTKASLLPGGLSVDRPEAPYGPVWLLITALVALVSGENLFLNMLIFKLIAAASAIAAFILVDWLARRLYPARRLRILVLFGWSPLLLFETIGNGHNDILMMVCVLGAFLCMLHGRARTAFMLLVLGALVKYVSAVFVPLWLVYELRHLAAKRNAAPASLDGDGAEAHRGEGSVFARATRATIQAVGEIDKGAAFRLLASVTVIGLVMVVAFYAPYWDGFATFTGLGQQLRPLYYNGSIVGIIAAPLQIFVPSSQWPALDKTVRLVFYSLFGLYAFFQIRRLWSLRDQSDLRDVITASAKLTFAALVLITFWFQPWYVIWLLPLAPLAIESFVRRQGIMLALGALLTYAVSNFLLIGESDASRDFFVQFFEILVTFAPLLLLRAAPYEQGWFSRVRQYIGALGEGLSQHTVFWERAMLILVLIVAAMLRLLRLGNLLAPLPTGSAEISTLKEISSDLKLVLTDPQGLHGPFVAIQKALVYVFGPTPLAALLPSAVIGTLTVYVIYLLAREILRQGHWKGASTIALLSALLAATSRWHVSLSRSGMEVILLPLLMCTATLWLLMALRLSGKVAVAIKPGEPVDAQILRTRRRALLLYAGCGICTGLACDLAPGLWLLPMLVLTFLVVWRLRHPHLFKYWRQQLAVLIGIALVSGLPTIGYFLSLRYGLPPGSPLLARSSVQANPGPGILTLDFWGQVLHNVGDVLRLLISQDYTSGYPAVGSSPIIPVLLTPIFIIGLVILLARWKNPTAMALLLLTALPLVASIAIGASTGVIEAASVLPATCIIPALALYEIFTFLGHLPIVLDRMNGVRVFTTPEQIGRVLLLLFLVVSTIRTFFWYFESTLPSHAGTQQTPSWTAPKDSVAQVTLYGDQRIVARTPGSHVWTIVRL
ncbi:MAG TPA: glycosyltransferase 87 family protein [Ktedonobacterales bacterium]|nr:glycosyltransferase 87 family protein [Ktedonobacterales bacterium]